MASKYKVIRIIWRIVVWTLAALALIIVGSFALFYYKKDDVSKYLLTMGNSYIGGSLEFSDVKFNPFVNFPEASITIKDPAIYKDSADLVSGSPAILLKELHVSLDVKKLLNSKLVVSSIILNDGFIHHEKYSDSTNNLQQTLALNNAFSSSDTADTNDSVLVDLESITIRNVLVKHDGLLPENSFEVNINEMETRFYMDSDSLLFKVESGLDLVKLRSGKLKILTGKKVNLSADCWYSFKRGNIIIDESKVSIGKLDFDASGEINTIPELRVDMKYAASQEDVSKTLNFLNNDYLQQIYKGKVYIDGTVKGKVKNSMPQVVCNFGIKDMAASIPRMKDSITDLNFYGYFKSGRKKDLSDAKLHVDTLHVNLPGGKVEGKLDIYNFEELNTDLYVNADLNLDVFNYLIEDTVISDLKGNLTIESKYNGMLIGDNIVGNRISHNNLLFDSVSVSIPDIIDIDYLDGRVYGNTDTININDLMLISGSSDFLINGIVYNLTSFILKQDENLISDMDILSDELNLVKFLPFVKDLDKSFPYTIYDVDLNTKLVTSYSDMLDTVMPQMKFEINELEAEVSGLLPPLKLSNGVFVLGSEGGDGKLEFNDFIITGGGNRVIADYDFFLAKESNNYMKIDANIEKVRPSYFFDIKSDSGIVNSNTIVDGKLNCNIALPSDSNMLFKSVDIIHSNLRLQNGERTLAVNGLNIKGADIQYELIDETNYLASFWGEYSVSFDSLRSPVAGLNNYSCDILAEGELLTISALNGVFPGSLDKTEVRVKPFSRPVDLEVELSLSNIKMEEILQRYDLDTMICGDVVLDIDLKAMVDTGTNWLSTINGSMDISGEDMIYYGYNLNSLLKNLEKSRKFTLVDVGGMLLAGPIGLAATKSSDYTRILLVDRNAMTEIPHISSDWDIVNGVCEAKDVAFSTKEFRVAANGKTSIINQDVDFELAVLNRKGCEKLTQKVTGTWTNIGVGKLTVITSLIAPVTDLINDVTTFDCKPFYTGKVPHPYGDSRRINLKKE